MPRVPKLHKTQVHVRLVLSVFAGLQVLVIEGVLEVPVHLVGPLQASLSIADVIFVSVVDHHCHSMLEYLAHFHRSIRVPTALQIVINIHIASFVFSALDS